MKNRTILVLALLVSLSILNVETHADTPASQRSGNVQFITGGIGQEERTAIEAVKSQYNLHVMSAGTDGAFTGDTKLNILDKNNNSILETNMGPLLYAKLPNGTYTVEGILRNQMKSQKITVSENKPAHIHFSWK
ncbi:MAG: hypothetical protein K2Q01_07610 [Rickettsiales bacterium]|nr:hypothetical protein [Rickettsiales bacterium]